MSKFLDTDGLSYFWSKLKSKFDDLASKISSNTSNISTMSSKLSGIESGANKYTLPTASSSTLGGIKVGSNLTINDGVLSGTPNTTYNVATQSANGLLSSSDKKKLDGIASGAQVNTVTSVAGKTGAVTLAKSDVSLGNVANIDQSKAIKSITRSGTTFTATALDGTTTTFTQQDNNTTYSDATTSVHGLMSASDKTRVNNIDKNYRLSVGLVGHKIIPNNANLNTLDYIKVDSYRIVSNASVATLTNCPVSIAFRMDVYNASGVTYDDESTKPWVYRYREITTLAGEKWKQLVYSGNTAGQFVYDQWMKVVGSKGCEFELGFDSNDDLILTQHEY